MSYRQEEDGKNQQRMEGLVDQLQGKIKSYKKQIEEAEEIAALNLAKYRQVRKNLIFIIVGDLFVVIPRCRRTWARAQRGLTSTSRHWQEPRPLDAPLLWDPSEVFWTIKQRTYYLLCL